MSSRLSFMLPAICALMMQGCAQLTPPAPPPSPVRPQASLREPCVELPGVKSGERSAVLDWIINARRLYAICASRQMRSNEAADGAYATEPK